MLLALANVTVDFAILGEVGLQAMTVTHELERNFLRPATGKDVLAKVPALKVGWRLTCGEIHLQMTSGTDGLIAHATSSYTLPEE